MSLLWAEGGALLYRFEAFALDTDPGLFNALN
jgi:hypothetical protein